MDPWSISRLRETTARSARSSPFSTRRGGDGNQRPQPVPLQQRRRTVHNRDGVAFIEEISDDAGTMFWRQLRWQSVQPSRPQEQQRTGLQYQHHLVHLQFIHVVLASISVVALLFTSHCFTAFTAHLRDHISASLSSTRPLHLHSPLIQLDHAINTTYESLEETDGWTKSLQTALWGICPVVPHQESASPEVPCAAVYSGLLKQVQHSRSVGSFRYAASSETYTSISALRIRSRSFTSNSSYTIHILDTYLDSFDRLTTCDPSFELCSYSDLLSSTAQPELSPHLREHGNIHHKAKNYRRKNHGAYEETEAEKPASQRLWLSTHLELANGLFAYATYVDNLTSEAVALQADFAAACLHDAKERSHDADGSGWVAKLKSGWKHKQSEQRRKKHTCQGGEYAINSALFDAISNLQLQAVQLRHAANAILDALARIEAMRCGLRQLLSLATHDDRLDPRSMKWAIDEARQGGYYRTKNGPVFVKAENTDKVRSALLLAPYGEPETCLDLGMTWTQHLSVAQGQWEGILASADSKWGRKYGLAANGHGGPLWPHEISLVEWKVEQASVSTQSPLSRIDSGIRRIGGNTGDWLGRYAWLGVQRVLRGGHIQRGVGDRLTSHEKWSGVTIANIQTLDGEAERMERAWHEKAWPMMAYERG